jgi:hypothetical protein
VSALDKALLDARVWGLTAIRDGRKREWSVEVILDSSAGILGAARHAVYDTAVQLALEDALVRRALVSKLHDPGTVADA